MQGRTLPRRPAAGINIEHETMDDTVGETTTKRRGRMTPEEWHARSRPGEEIITQLADLFPSCVTAERWKPHRPFKVGIDRDLAEMGIISREDAHIALSV